MKALLVIIALLALAGLLYWQTLEPESGSSLQSPAATPPDSMQPRATTVPAIAPSPTNGSATETDTLPAPADPALQQQAELARQKQEAIMDLMVEFNENIKDADARKAIKAKTDKLIEEYNQAVLPVALEKIRQARSSQQPATEP